MEGPYYLASIFIFVLVPFFAVVVVVLGGSSKLSIKPTCTWRQKIGTNDLPVCVTIGSV